MNTGTARSRCRSRWWRWRRMPAPGPRDSALTMKLARRAVRSGESPLARITVPIPPASGMPLALTDTSYRKLYVTANVRAVPRSGEELFSVERAHASPVEIQRCGRQCHRHRQGAAGHGPDRAGDGEEHRWVRGVDNLALSQLVPAGWEIRNYRLENADTSGDRTQDARATAARTGGCRANGATRKLGPDNRADDADAPPHEPPTEGNGAVPAPAAGSEVGRAFSR